MAMLVTNLKIADYARWKEAFDGFEAQRQQAGLTNTRVFRSESDPHDVLVAFDVADEAAAGAFLGSEQLRDGMRNAGVTAPPQSGFLKAG